MKCSLTPPGVDGPTAGQMPRASNSPVGSVAAAGYKTARCTPRSPAEPAHGFRSADDAPVHSSAFPRNSPSGRCHSSSPSDSWTQSSHTGGGAPGRPGHNTASPDRSGGSVPGVSASPPPLSLRRRSPTPSSFGPPLAYPTTSQVNRSLMPARYNQPSVVGSGVRDRA